MKKLTLIKKIMYLLFAITQDKNIQSFKMVFMNDFVKIVVSSQELGA